MRYGLLAELALIVLAGLIVIGALYSLTAASVLSFIALGVGILGFVAILLSISVTSKKRINATR